MKDLKLIPVLKVNKDIKMSDNSSQMFKCSTDTNLKLLGMENQYWFECMDMDSKEIVFEQQLTLDGKGRNAHNFIVQNNQKYVTIQTSLNTIKMFKILKVNNTFEFKENEALRICYDKKDVITFCEFDKNFENIFIVLNGNIFEQRSMNNIN
eukprot:51716_1